MFDFLKSLIILLIGVGIFGCLLFFCYLKLKEKIQKESEGVHNITIITNPIQTLNANIQIKGIISFSIVNFKLFSKKNVEFEEIITKEFSNMFEMHGKLKTINDIQYMQKDLCTMVLENIGEYEKDYGVMVTNLQIDDYERVRID